MTRPSRYQTHTSTTYRFRNTQFLTDLPQLFARKLSATIRMKDQTLKHLTEVPRILFLGICLDFYYYLRRVLLPKFGFHFDWGSVSQALVEPSLVPP